MTFLVLSLALFLFSLLSFRDCWYIRQQTGILNAALRRLDRMELQADFSILDLEVETVMTVTELQRVNRSIVLPWNRIRPAMLERLARMDV